MEIHHQKKKEVVVMVQREILMRYNKNICMVRELKCWNRLLGKAAVLILTT